MSSFAFESVLSDIESLHIKSDCCDVGPNDGLVSGPETSLIYTDENFVGRYVQLQMTLCRQCGEYKGCPYGPSVCTCKHSHGIDRDGIYNGELCVSLKRVLRELLQTFKTQE
jgi:hypothetical protein